MSWLYSTPLGPIPWPFLTPRCPRPSEYADILFVFPHIMEVHTGVPKDFQCSGSESRERILLPCSDMYMFLLIKAQFKNINNLVHTCLLGKWRRSWHQILLPFPVFLMNRFRKSQYLWTTCQSAYGRGHAGTPPVHRNGLGINSLL